MTPAEFKQARNKSGLSQSALGKIIGVSDRTIRRWESADPETQPPHPIACKALAWMLQPGRPAEWPDVKG